MTKMINTHIINDVKYVHNISLMRHFELIKYSRIKTGRDKTLEKLYHSRRHRCVNVFHCHKIHIITRTFELGLSVQ